MAVTKEGFLGKGWAFPIRPRNGRLRLTASETVSMLLVQNVIPVFLEHYPEMEVDLVAEPAFIDIVAEGYDAGFRLGDEVPRDMVAVRFGKSSRMLPVASPAYLEGRDLPRTPDDLSHMSASVQEHPMANPTSGSLRGMAM